MYKQILNELENGGAKLNPLAASIFLVHREQEMRAKAFHEYGPLLKEEYQKATTELNRYIQQCGRTNKAVEILLNPKTHSGLELRIGWS